MNGVRDMEQQELARAALRRALDTEPRHLLGHWPTPLESLPALAAEIGAASLYIKRDDCTGLALGGNKVRKLEYLVAEARAAGADTVITLGGVQSNHARQTAAACARSGLRCELILTRVVPGTEPPYEASGNVVLDRLFGAGVHFADDARAAAECLSRLTAQVRDRGGEAFVIPPGGSTATGSLGYVRAALELLDQLEALLPDEVGRIVVAASTGGTLAGLACGLEWSGAPIEVIGVSVYAPASEVEPGVRSLAREMASRLGLPEPSLARLSLTDRQLGPGYGLPTDAMRDALLKTARREGIVLDPVYTGKAMAEVLARAQEGDPDGEGATLFWHTGGAPGLFAHGAAVA